MRHVSFVFSIMELKSPGLVVTEKNNNERKNSAALFLSRSHDSDTKTPTNLLVADFVGTIFFLLRLHPPAKVSVQVASS